MASVANGFKYRWYAKGDVNAFFGLMLDNMTGLVILGSILIGIFGMPADIVLLKMVPGTALGVMLGDFAYSYMAFKLAEKEQRQDVTAMPLGLDAISLFAISFGVIGPAYLATKSGEAAWAVGMALLIITGVIKIICSFGGQWIRQKMPRAALLGSIGAIAIVFIGFMPFIKIFHSPLAGIPAFGIILLTLVAKVRLPYGTPGALAAVAFGCAIFYAASGFGFTEATTEPSSSMALALPLPTLTFLDGFTMSLKYLPLAIPIAIVNVIGGIDNTESAAVAGDSYKTRDILLVEGFATLIAGFAGGVIQNTPYIGHPAYKGMGGRAAYTIAAGLFIGIGASFGLVGLLISILPEAVMVPILVFIGLEVIVQAFTATKQKHLPAVAICFIPVLANLIFIQVNMALAAASADVSTLRPDYLLDYRSIMMLGNGFVCTAMLWAAITTFLIDHQLTKAATAALVGGIASLFGIIHSPFADGSIFLPSGNTPTAVYLITGGYLLMSASYFIMAAHNKKNPPVSGKRK